MAAILFAIWEFLVAAWPTIVAIGGYLGSIYATLKTVAGMAAMVALLVAIIEILFDPRGKQRVGQFIANIVGGALDKAKPLLDDLAPALNALAGQFASAIRIHGAPIAATLGTEFQDLARTALETQRTALAKLGESTPDNAIDGAAEAFTVAFGSGLASHGVAVAFEALFPEKLNTLNGIAPILGEMAGFKDVAGFVLDPLYKSAFGKSLEYYYDSIFKPDFASEGDAVRWHSRRLMSEADLREVFKWSPLKEKYEQAFVDSAYVPVSPRALATAYVDVKFPREAVRKMMEFAGNRDADIETMLDAFEIRSTNNVRNQYLAALITASEKGIMTDADLDAGLDELQYADTAKHFIHLTIATKKLEQLDQLYRKSVSEAYKFGLISDADYVPHLEAIGIAEADANAHYAVDSIAKRGKEALEAAREAKTEAAREQGAAVRAALAQYSAGIVNEAGLAADLALAGLSAPLIAYAVSIANARRAGSLVLIHGRRLDPAGAEVLRREVAAIGEQTVKALITPEVAIAQLAGLQVPGPIREALAAKWAAQLKQKLPI